MLKELDKIAKNLSGKILVIGFDEDESFIKKIEENKKMELFSHLTNNTKKKDKNGKKIKRSFFGNKIVNIKKLYKEMKKEKYDYIICEFLNVKSHFNNFILNSYKMTNKKIYFIVNDDLYDYEEIERRYTRYNCKTLSKGKDEEYLVEIDVSNMKMNILKRILYRFRDIGYNIVEFISNVIIS